MRWSGGVNRACRVAGVIAFALLITACARSQPKEYGIGSTGGVAQPGSPQEFAVNVGDLVHFQEDSSALSGEAQNILRDQARWLNQYSQYAITIQGHADERGTHEFNLRLSEERLSTVSEFLRRGGYRGALELIPKGDTEPFSGVNRSVFSRDQLYDLDRRVELRLWPAPHRDTRD